jgi:hypothetical protein
LKRWPPQQFGHEEETTPTSLDAGEGLSISASAPALATTGTAAAAAGDVEERHYDLIVLVGHKGSMRNMILRLEKDSGLDLSGMGKDPLKSIYSASAVLVTADPPAGEWLSRGAVGSRL